MRGLSAEAQMVYDAVCTLPRPVTAKEIADHIGHRADGTITRMVNRGILRRVGHVGSRTTWRYDL